MKTIKNLFFIIIGSIMILFSLKLLIIDGSNEYAKIIGGICFGMVFIYPSLKKDSKTTSEIFVEKEDLEIPIWWKRLIGFIIDYIIILIIYSLTLSLILQVYEVRLDKLFNSNFLLAPFYVFYYFIQEYIFNTSIGKSIFKLRVVSAINGDKPTLTQIIIRSFTRLLPIDLFFFFTKRPIGLHDIVSKTVLLTKD
tara:strand:- start:966 stop:1550 length:585 start_codon:yes stop_codon:yes gene_type:complete